MDIQVIFIVILSVLVVVLAAMLGLRRVRQRVAIRDESVPDPDEFQMLLRENASDGTIQKIAGRVSNLLKGSFSCVKIVFLRKQRGFLELNYYFGITRFQRNQFRLRFNQALASFLTQDYRLRPIQELAPVVTEGNLKTLKEFGFTAFFPIFWRDNLYGVYFVASDRSLTADVTSVSLAGLAQSLSAAYHIKWHESRYERLQKKADSAMPPRALPEPSPRTGLRILKLVRHKGAETIVPKIIDTVSEELGAEAIAFVYEGRERNAPLLSYSPDGGVEIAPPDRACFNGVQHLLSGRGVEGVHRLFGADQALNAWGSVLKKAGIGHVATFPVSSRRQGLLLISGKVQPDQMAQRMRQFAPTAMDLVEYAESYERIQELSFTDGLTGLNNQRYFRKRLHEEISRAGRYQRSLGLIMFDMDDLKGINDSFGHLAGDTVLKRLGQILKSSIRTIDIVARYGGDEFCVIMPEADIATCRRFMARLQEKIATSRFLLPDSDKEVRCTISQGAAVFPENAADETKLIFAADMALLTAKESGRNSHLVYNDEMTLQQS